MAVTFIRVNSGNSGFASILAERFSARLYDPECTNLSIEALNRIVKLTKIGADSFISTHSCIYLPYQRHSCPNASRRSYIGPKIKIALG
jgi:hypothetical protein